MTNAALLEHLGHAHDCLTVTPALRLPHKRVDPFGNLEFISPNDSRKDPSAYRIRKCAIERSEIHPGTTAAESPSGNFTMSMTAFYQVLGLFFIAATDANTNTATEKFLRASRERILNIAEPNETDVFPCTRLDRAQQLCQDIPGAFWPNQYDNPDGAKAHYHRSCEEPRVAISRIDYLFVGVFVGVGNRAIIARLLHCIKMPYPQVRAIAVNAVKSVIFDYPSKRRPLPEIGSSICPAVTDSAEIDDVTIIPEYDSVTACYRLLNQHGLFTRQR